MPSTPDLAVPEPLLEVIEDLAPPALHAAAWATCAGPGWFFGHSSTGDSAGRFWQMDLTADAAFDAIWEHARPRCEALAGTGLRVIRQYANGHTYGLGGAAHADDERPGTFTLLYYPNPEWHEHWEGETVYYDPAGEIAFSVRPRPNRAVFFDSRIPHADRAPSRAFPGLRVTIAFKLEATTAPPAAVSPAPPPPAHDADTVRMTEIARDGATRTLQIQVPEAIVAVAVAQRLATLAQTVRLPGFGPGQVPQKLMHDRYGARARHDTLRQIAAETIDASLLPAGLVPATCTLAPDSEGGAGFDITATSLPDLPLDPASWHFDRLSPPATLPPGLTLDAATTLCAERLTQDVLDVLDAAPVPLLPALVEREFAALQHQAEAQGLTEATGGPDWTAQLHAMAERRLRLGCLILELARRFGLHAATGPQLEADIVSRILAIATVTDRTATQDELATLAQ